MLTLSAAAETNTVADKQTSTPRFIFVGGEVLAPGRFSWTNGMTLLDGIRCAGGYSVSGDRKHIEIRSTGVSTQICNFDVASSSPAKNPKLKPGDMVMVPRSKVGDAVTAAGASFRANVHLPPPNWNEKFIMVEGEVHKAGPLRWTNSMRLSMAIKLAGGLTEFADPIQIKIQHFNGGAALASYLAATNSPRQDHILLRGDRIVVARKGPTSTKQ
jgi:protein involved in polysaccharide export with SLBB domain